jgi:hypothetical protein
MATGQITTYDLTTGVIVDIDPMIRMLSPTDTPLQNGLGLRGDDPETVLSTDTVFEKKFEWQDETILIPSSTAGATSTTGASTLVVATGDREKFSTGDAILIVATDEIVRVTGYNATAHTLDIARSHGAAAADTIASGGALVSLGAQLAEGSDPEAARAVDWTNRYNLTQIFGPTKIEVSQTEQAIRKYGLNTTMMDKQVANRTKEMAIQIEQALLNGDRVDDTSGKIRMTGGINYWITTNVDSATTQITSATLLDQMQACWDLGGVPDRCLGNSTQIRAISALDEGDIRLGRMDTGRGQTVQYFDSDFGRLSMVLHRWANTKNLFLFSREQAQQKVLRPLRFEMLAKTGDSIKGQIVKEMGLQFEAERWAAKFTALT